MSQKSMMLNGREDRKTILKLSGRLLKGEGYNNPLIEVVTDEGELSFISALSYIFGLRQIELPENIERMINKDLDSVQVNDGRVIGINESNVEQIKEVVPYIELLHNDYKNINKFSYM